MTEIAALQQEVAELARLHGSSTFSYRGKPVPTDAARLAAIAEAALKVAVGECAAHECFEATMPGTCEMCDALVDLAALRRQG